MSAQYINHPGQATRIIPDFEPKLTARQEHILHIVRSFGGNRSRAARQLGINVAAVQKSLRSAEKAGARVPPGATRRGIPNTTVWELGPRCGRLMTRGGICGRREDHPNFCVNEAAWMRKRIAKIR